MEGKLYLINGLMFSRGQFVYLVLAIWLMQYFGKLTSSDESCKNGEDWNISYFQKSKEKNPSVFQLGEGIMWLKLFSVCCYSNFKNRLYYKCPNNRINLQNRLQNHFVRVIESNINFYLSKKFLPKDEGKD